MPPILRTRTAGLVAAVVIVLLLVAVVVVSVRDGEDDLDATRADDPASTRSISTTTSAPTSAPTSTGAPSSSTETAAPSTATTGTRPRGTEPAAALDRAVAVDSPSAVVDLPGGDVLVATLAGEVLRADLATGRTERVLDLRSAITTGGERGLLGMTADPDGARLVLHFTNRDGDTEIRSWPLEEGRPIGGAGDGVLHFRLDQPYANHNGGHLLYGPDGALWVGTGDGGGAGDPGEAAQDPSRLLGKMLRLRLDPAGGATPASGNPDWGGRPEVWGIGLRNPWRYTFDRLTGRLWIADVGQRSTEEVSVVEVDAPRPNFGWDDMEGDRPFEGEPDPSFVAPVVTYGRDAGCAVTGGHVYRGDVIGSLYGWYLFGDYCGGWVRAVPADDPTGTPVELIDDAGSVLSFAELDDGELLVLTREGVHRLVGP